MERKWRENGGKMKRNGEILRSVGERREGMVRKRGGNGREGMEKGKY